MVILLKYRKCESNKWNKCIDLSKGRGAPDGGKYIDYLKHLPKMIFLSLNDLSNNWNILNQLILRHYSLIRQHLNSPNSKTLNTSAGFRLLSSPATCSYSSLLNPI